MRPQHTLRNEAPQMFRSWGSLLDDLKEVERTCVSSNHTYVLMICAFSVGYHCSKRGCASRSRILVDLIGLGFIARGRTFHSSLYAYLVWFSSLFSHSVVIKFKEIAGLPWWSSPHRYFSVTTCSFAQLSLFSSELQQSFNSYRWYNQQGDRCSVSLRQFDFSSRQHPSTGVQS